MARLGQKVLAATLGLALAACGGDDDGAPDDGGDGAGADATPPITIPVDAAVSSGPDAALNDAAPNDAAPLDAALTDGGPPDAAPPPDLRVVVSSMRTFAAAEEALDIDGDGDGDDRLGQFWREMEAATGRQAQVQLDAALASGAALHLVAIPAPPGGLVRALLGQDQDGDPTDNFSGAEPFSIAPGTPLDGILDGQVSGQAAVAGPGDIPLLLPVTGAVAAPVLVRSVGTRLVAVLGDGSIEGRLGGALLSSDVADLVYPAVVLALNDVIAADCPTGPASCADGSPGQALLDAVDLDGDGALDPNEVGQLPFVDELLASDLDLFDQEGAFNPNADGVPESLSYGLAVSGVGAAFALPGEPALP